MAHLRGAVGNRAEAFQRGHEFAGCIDLDREPASAQRRDVGRQALRPCPEARQALGELVTMRHSISPFEMAGAPIAAPPARGAAGLRTAALIS